MKPNRLATLIGVALLSLALAACSSFTPVYGDRAGGGLSEARFFFAEPGSRIEQIVLNRLRTVFPQPARPGDPTLSVSVSAGGAYEGISNAFPARRPLGRRVTATVSIVGADGTAFSATRFVDTSYQSDSVTPADAAAADGAMERAARAVAESLRAAILADYRPGMSALVAPIAR